MRKLRYVMRTPVDKHERLDWAIVGEDLDRRESVESRLQPGRKASPHFSPMHFCIIEEICLGGVAQMGAVCDGV